MTRSSRIVAAVGILILAGISPAATAGQAPSAAAPRKTLEARRLNGAPPAIDGRLDDPCWREAPAATDFIQRDPNPGRPATQPTEARVIYDDQAVYVGARMYDSAPDSIYGPLARRDYSGQSDWFHVIIDSYHDHRTAFRFSINPRGVEKDVLHSDDYNEDITWDAVWHARVATDSLGWTAEFMIPLSQLRFSSSDPGPDGADPPQVWGINFLRQISRRNESDWWSPVPPDAPGLVSIEGELTGLSGLHPPRRLEAAPYVVGRLTRQPGSPADPFYKRTDPFGSFGSDFKYGVTSDLTLTGTINPDFGQVEADPGQVNLTAFETFFPEKRPFFLEGNNLFTLNSNFPYSIRGGSFGNDNLFYSRRIGRSPQGSAPDSAIYAGGPEATTILGAVKLSGKTRRGVSVGVFDAVTSAEHDQYSLTGTDTGRILVEPATNYLVARGIKDFDGGQSAVGTIFSATNRRLNDNAVGFLRSAAYAGGVDGRHRLFGGNYEVDGVLVGSYIRGSETSIERIQEAPGHYFQRPGAGYLHHDPTRTSLSGFLGNLKAEKIGGQWRGGVYGHLRSPGFETNDLGFMSSADWMLEGAWVGYRQFTPGKIVKSWDLNANEWSGWSFGGERRTTGLNTNGFVQLNNYWAWNGSIDHELPALSLEALRGGPALKVPTYSNFFMAFISDTRPVVSGELDLNWRREPASRSHSEDVSLPLNWRPSTRIRLSLSPGISLNRNSRQYVARLDASGTPHYVHATLDQRTASLTTRFSYTFTPDLSLELYAQPFISAGRFSDFKDVADPLAARYADRFRNMAGASIAYDEATRRYAVDLDGDGLRESSFANPDFNYKQLRSNLVLRWEYRPGSALFVVWSQGRTGAAPTGTFDLSRDLGDLFRLEATNVVLVKLSYWFNA